MLILLIFTCLIICSLIIISVLLNNRANTEITGSTAGNTQPSMTIPGTLFGNRKSPVMTASAPPPTVNITLPLSLKGILASTDSQRSLAILQSPSGQHSYREGEMIADVENAYVQSINQNSILIRTQQGMTPLYLNETIKENSPPSTQHEKKTRIVAKYLTNYLVASPIYKDEKLLGYKFNPRADSVFYLKTGLILNEVVIKINGQPLSEATTADKYMEQLESLRDVQLTVLRDNQLQNIYINLATIETSLDTESHEGTN